MSRVQPGPRAGLTTGALLGPPLLWLGVAYLGALAALLVTAFFSVGEFTSTVIKVFTLDNFSTLLRDSIYRTVAFRTISIAALVTVVDALLALPIAFFMAKIASPRWQR